jgi:hypothetical protein
MEEKKENKLSIFKIFSAFGFIANWAQESLKPDPDGSVVITVEEMTKLVEGFCEMFGWTADIELGVKKK